MQKVSLGPLVGKVTQTTARILLEFEKDGIEEVTLTAILSGDSMKSSSQVKANRIAVFKFESLEPFTTYEISCSVPLPVPKCSFRTLSGTLGAPTSFNIAVVSGNSDYQTKKTPLDLQLWQEVAGKARKRDIDYIFHIGNQIYTDVDENAYAKCIAELKNHHPPWNEEDIREIIRSCYRKTFKNLYQAAAMANCPNIGIFDEHDIRKGWGSKPDDSNLNTLDGFYCQQARVVYYEYMRQLWEDVDFTKLDEIKAEYHYHILNQVGVFFVDYAGHNASGKKGEGSKKKLGEEQWAELNKCFHPTAGEFKDCSTVILVSPVPIALFNKKTKLGAHDPEEFNEQWLPSDQAEQTQLFMLLNNWKRAGSQREVLVLAGNVNHGGYSDIIYNKQPLFKQMITSGITQKAPPKWSNLLSKIDENSSREIEGLWKVKHHDWVSANNFGILGLQKGVIEMELFTASETQIPGPEKKIIERRKQLGKSCTIF